MFTSQSLPTPAHGSYSSLFYFRKLSNSHQHNKLKFHDMINMQAGLQHSISEHIKLRVPHIKHHFRFLGTVLNCRTKASLAASITIVSSKRSFYSKRVMVYYRGVYRASRLLVQTHFSPPTPVDGHNKN